MSIQDLIERYERINNFSNKVSLNKVIEDLKELDKLSHPVIPEYVAKWINYCKFTNVRFTDAITINEVHFYNYSNQSDLPRLKEFLSQEDNQEIFIRAWFNEYEICNKYIIKFKNISDDQCYLNCINNNDKTKEWILNDELEYPNIVTKHTREELEQSGFSWVFDCPGIEIIEVIE